MIDFQVKHFQEVDSTNSYLKELVKQSDVPEGTVILADFQTTGKGRGLNAWISDRAQNLTFSFFINPDLPASCHFSLVEFVSLALVDTLSDYKVQAKIKWPNDIYVADKKIAGILFENVLSGDKIISSVVGIGLNVNQTVFPAELTNPVSLKTFVKQEVNQEELVKILLDCLSNRYEQMKRGSYDLLHKEYCSNIYKKDETIRYWLDGKLYKGTLRTIGGTGELCIEDENGELSGYLFGEIKLVIT